LEHLPLLFLIVIIIQIGYLFIFDLGLFFYRSQQGKVRPVSIVVAARNELKNLQSLVPALLSQDHPEFEVIIVDDQSTDDTLKYLETMKGNDSLKVLSIQGTPDNVNRKKYAVQKGIEQASNDIILLTDADCRIKSDQWAAIMSSSYHDHTEIVIGISTYLKRKGLLNRFIRYETLMTALQYLSLASLKIPYMGIGRNLSYKKSFFIRQKGFEGIESINGGDDDLFVNKNATGRTTNISFSPNTLVLSVPKTSWTAYFGQKRRHLAIGKYYKIRDKLILGAFHLTAILVWLLAILLAFTGFDPYIILIGLGARWWFLMLTLDTILKKTGEQFEIGYIYILDFLYSLYYITAGFAGLFFKNDRWN